MLNVRKLRRTHLEVVGFQVVVKMHENSEGYVLDSGWCMAAPSLSRLFPFQYTPLDTFSWAGSSLLIFCNYKVQNYLNYKAFIFFFFIQKCYISGWQ